MSALKNTRYAFNAYIALLIFLFTKRKSCVWVIGGHSGNLYTDNAKVFYEFICNRFSNIKIYWMANTNSHVWGQVKGGKLKKGSIKGYLYFFHSEVSLFSDTFNSDIAPLAYILPFIRNIYFNRFKVYLSHGTIAFKKMPRHSPVTQSIKERVFRSYDMAIASTHLEKKIMTGYNISEAKICLAGSARHDQLKTVKQTHDMILVAPTWRCWLKNKKSLKGSHFFESYVELLTNPRLYAYLKSHRITLAFYLHHLFHRYISGFEPCQNDVVRILSSDADIADYIMRSNMIVTDYSSVCSDFYYLKKPVAFFQFDRDRYLREVGSEIDLERDVFGEVRDSVEDLVDLMIENVDRGYVLSPKQKEGEKYFAHFFDDQNCMRIYNAIEQKIKAGNV